MALTRQAIGDRIKLMGRTDVRQHWKLALGFGLGTALCAPNAPAQSLPLPLWNPGAYQSVAMDAGHAATGMAMFMNGSSLLALLQGPWKAYARKQLLPDWGAPLSLPELPDETRLERRDGLLPAFAQRLLYTNPSHHDFNIGVQRGHAPDSPLLPDSLNDVHLDLPGAYLRQRLFTPTYAYELSPSSSIGVSAVLAYQDFSTYGFGHANPEQAYYQARFSEAAFGTGVRLGLTSEVLPGLTVGAAYQTQIEMDPFYRYRGVFREPGEFDIPASADLGVVMQATGSTSLVFDVRHIQYSDVDPFTSAMLPNRFLALLGDGTSPTFAWQDLTVYRVGFSWESEQSDLAWSLDWRSARQPTPTSSLLADALAPEFADNYWTFGVSQPTGEHGQLSLTASYTPSDYFLTLNGQGFEADSTLDRMELEARWTYGF